MNWISPPHPRASPVRCAWRRSTTIGYALSDQLEMVAEFLARTGLTLGIAFVAAIALYLTVKIAWRQWVLSRLKGARITVEQLLGLIA